MVRPHSGSPASSSFVNPQTHLHAGLTLLTLPAPLPSCPRPQETELLAAGFPCVDVSRAGLRRGLEGQSTGLVRHVFRLLQASAQAVARLGSGLHAGVVAVMVGTTASRASAA